MIKLRTRVIGLILLAVFWGTGSIHAKTYPELSGETLACIECHITETHVIYQEWGTSKHYRGNVGCYECHRAETGEVDVFDHYGFNISIIVSPKDCSRCHPRETQEFEESHHAKAGIILGSLDNFLADIVEGDFNFYGGSALTVSGCKQCHGAVVDVNDDGTLKATGWPNTGMGRFNPDGSVGACTACHNNNSVKNFYEQYDGLIALYNSKFAEPGANFMKILKENNLITSTQFDEDVEWIWWELWHHEGRRARHGVSMMAPDYTHWHGLYEVAKHWYQKFIPELREIAKVNMRSEDKNKVEGARKLQTAIDELLARPEHSWYTGHLPPEEKARREKAQVAFKKRYGG